MDPIAHTLTGAALARSGLNQRTAWATAALVVGANLPDIDALSYFFGGSDAALGFRRGWTHGVLAWALLPLLLWGSLLLLDRRRSQGPGDRPVLRPAWLLAICCLGVWSHPFLDWLNNYGVRLLMPFDGTWFYGDSVFIVDPWIWLLLGGGLFLASPLRGRVGVAWLAFGLFSTSLMLFAAPASLRPAKALWLVVVALVLAARWRGWLAGPVNRPRLARLSASLALLYIALMLSSTRQARSFAAQELARQGLQVERLMVAPVAVNPWRRDVLAATPQGYRYGDLRLLPSPRLRLNPRLIPLPRPTPAVESALQDPQIQGMLAWARFPYVEVEDRGDRWRVYILDARYTRSRTVGFGGAMVEVSKPGGDSRRDAETQRGGAER